jgi:hypothetical protein
MATRSLASMSVDALLKLRSDIGQILSRRADVLKKELRSLGQDYAEVGRIALYGKKKASKKAKAKDRDPTSAKTRMGRRAKSRKRAAVGRGEKGSVVVARKSRRKSAKRK